ncbi:unnamed protein product [Bursaphelenchus okinawaensis]|uniref:Very-long-chain 3-oxoacyl-CoA synthase n=1 Tax=Bursaphelenchus okinawaensis TaxID=465554 RepID=A0A811KXI2_9BILA|nr:unnamed protein product [Bursaphelenchus okinawaensis]CAG9113857.1 unnamed protein product [Bursaphelenchus okinawaensis]
MAVLNKESKKKILLSYTIYHAVLAVLAFGLNFVRQVARNFKVEEECGAILFYLQILTNIIASCYALLYLYHYIKQNYDFLTSKPVYRHFSDMRTGFRSYTVNEME